MYNLAVVWFKWALLGNVIIFTIFYRENIFQFQITLDFELYLFFCSGCLYIVHKLFVPSDDSLYKVLHYAVIKILMLYSSLWWLLFSKMKIA